MPVYTVEPLKKHVFELGLLTKNCENFGIVFFDQT